VNDESTYDIGVHILKTMSLEHRVQDLIVKDDERYKDNPRDLRIDNSKLKSFGIEFHDTMDAIERAAGEFGYKFVKKKSRHLDILQV
jgi:dTDP-4-dehydrorhamnose reductase